MGGFAGKSLCFIMAACGLASCSEMPSHVALSNRVTVEGSAAHFPACAMSVNFSATPRKLEEREAAYITASFPKFYRWQIDGLGLEEYRLTESATCFCADYEFSSDDIARMESRLRQDKKFSFVNAAEKPYARRSIELHTVADVKNKVRRHMFVSFPRQNAACLFVHEARFLEIFPERALSFLKSARASGGP